MPFELWFSVSFGLLVLLLVIAVLLRKLLLWMDGRGWILLPDPPAGGPHPSPLLELQSILQPQYRHVLEAKRQDAEKAEQDDQGGPGTAGRSRRRVRRRRRRR